jgi:hypothetical protein
MSMCMDLVMAGASRRPKIGAFAPVSGFLFGHLRFI